MPRRPSPIQSDKQQREQLARQLSRGDEAKARRIRYLPLMAVALEGRDAL